jgi:hypothetical protein
MLTLPKYIIVVDVFNTKKVPSLSNWNFEATEGSRINIF